ncbi:MAG TPA: aldehyde dehydrogenase family protein, partial [Spirochaetota bacterium]|nr:aldehyde dehydrogenase family protein [Spirochaetota bacterium]
MMKEYKNIYVNGEWITPYGTNVIDVINPCTEEPVARVAMGNEKDVDRAVACARKAFPSWSKTTVGERSELMTKLS